MLRKLALITGITTILLAGTFSYYIYTWSKELDSKFYHPIDSVPSKVFSKFFPIRKDAFIALAELEARLKIRGYTNNSDFTTEINDTGAYRIRKSPDDAYTEVLLFLQEFDYPETLLDIHFDDFNHCVSHGRKYSILWKNGKIEQIINEDLAAKEIESVSLEPILIARLNKSNTEARKTIPLNQIPTILLKAIISVEDRRFLDHFGIDLKGFARSIYINIKARAYKQGASTITQQLIRNIYLTRAKTIKRKIKEMVMAILMEFRYSKDEILEKYLNEVYFGQLGSLEIHGVGEAAKFYFGKNIDQLSIAEQAFLAGIVKGPYYYSPFRYFNRAKERQEFVLKKMYEEKAITEKQYFSAINEDLNFVKTSTVIDRAPYFTDYVKAQISHELTNEELLGAGYSIYTTLDVYFQNLAEETVKTKVEEIEKRNTKRYKLDINQKLQGVFVLTDPKTGHILSIVGGKSFSASNYNRALYMKRQIGSTFKPIVYLTALIEGSDAKNQPFSTLSLLEDKPFVYRYDNQIWRPKNYTNKYIGNVSFKYALANSINTVTAKLATDLSIEKVAKIGSIMGIENEIPLLPSIALGTIEASAFELARVYNTLANFGIKRDLTSLLLVIDEESEPIIKFEKQKSRVLPEPETAYLVKMLENVIQSGTAKTAIKLGMNHPAAGKTGTTNNYRDSWFVGFTNSLLGVAWVGFDKNLKEENIGKIKITGANAALLIWSHFMKNALAEKEKEDLHYPEGVLIKKPYKLNLKTGRIECSEDATEFFIEKNLPSIFCIDQ